MLDLAQDAIFVNKTYEEAKALPAFRNLLRNVRIGVNKLRVRGEHCAA